MQAKPKSNGVIASELVNGEDGKVLVFTVGEIGKLNLRLELLSQSNKDHAMVHGLVQRISDAAALPFNKVTNAYPTPQEKFDAMRELVEFYETGTEEWTRKRKGGTGTGGESGLLLDALCRMYPESTREKLSGWLKARKPEERAGLVNEARVKATMDEIRAERAPKNVDASALLAELG